jgi:uncharacterized protein
MIALVSRAAIAAAMAVIAASGSGVVEGPIRPEAPRLSRVQSAPGRPGQVLFPELTSPVNDFARVIDMNHGTAMDAAIRRLFMRTRDVVVVATLRTCAPTADIRECSMKVFDNHGKGIGAAGRDNGVLILLAVDDRQVRITTGSGMESIVTDRIAADIVREMTPSFRRRDYGAGLQLGVDRLIATILQARH